MISFLAQPRRWVWPLLLALAPAVPVFALFLQRLAVLIPPYVQQAGEQITTAADVVAWACVAGAGMFAAGGPFALVYRDRSGKDGREKREPSEWLIDIMVVASIQQAPALVAAFFLLFVASSIPIWLAIGLSSAGILALGLVVPR